MNFQQFFYIARARYLVILVTFMVTVVAATIISINLPKKFIATATILIDVKSDPTAGLIMPTSSLPNYNIATQKDIITSPRVANGVIKLLKLDESQVIRDQWINATKGKGQFNTWLSGLLLRALEVAPSNESNVIAINYASTDSAFSAAVANAFAQSYINANIELKVEPAKQYAAWFEQQTRILRDKLEDSQAKLSAYQQKVGIVASGDRLDSEAANLNATQVQLATAETQAAEARSKQNSRGGDTLSDVMQNSLILSLKGDIARKEATMDEIASNLGVNHPSYIRLSTEIASLKAKLASESRQIASSMNTNTRVNSGMVSELKNAVQSSKQRILDLSKQHDEIAVLQREVDGAKRAYDAVSQRSIQTSLESQSTQTNISILTPASESAAPASPNVMKNILGSVIAGLLLGFGLAVAIEMLNKRVRSVYDLDMGLGVPVLAVLVPRDDVNPVWRRLKTVNALPRLTA
jgi:succinoglycan biosynthesis transport protein ExoP